jgi:LacI family transcriptional regulator
VTIPPDRLARRARRVTLVDVARLASVDKAVVSRVVNDDPLLNIRPETRARVVAAIKELDYRPNVAARSLRTSRARTVGLFIPDFANPVYAEIITGAETAAIAHGYALVAGSSAAATAQTYLDLLGQGRVDGLLLAGGPTSDDEQRMLAALGMPWLLVNRLGGKARRYVVLDDDRAAQIAVEHLLELGHTRIAHVAGPRGADTARRRRAGYVKAMRKAGLSADNALIEPGDYTPQGGAEATHRLLTSGSAPTAIFVANVASAVGVLSTLRHSGLSVPRDVSVVAVHDLPLAEHLVPALTTVRMPLHLLGARAVELLLSTRPDEPVEEIVRDATELVVRDSAGPPP